MRDVAKDVFVQSDARGRSMFWTRCRGKAWIPMFDKLLHDARFPVFVREFDLMRQTSRAMRYRCVNAAVIGLLVQAHVARSVTA